MKDHARHALLGVLLAVCAGCGDEMVSGNPQSGQCKDLRLETDPVTARTIATQVPVTMTPYCSTKAEFLWEGVPTQLVFVAYGSPTAIPVSCPGGACANTVCALDYGAESHLFDATWSNNEPPLTISAECPAIALNASGDTATQCTTPPPSGRQHPILADRRFRNFLELHPVPGQLGICARLLPPGAP